MQGFIVLFILSCAGVVLQGAVVPAFLPRVLQPDVFMLMGMAALAFGSAEFGFTALFVMGLMSGLLGTGRLGVAPICFLLAASAVLKIYARQMTRGELASAWVGGMGGTFLAHLLYSMSTLLLGAQSGLLGALGDTASHSIAACVWGVPVVYCTGLLMFRMKVMSPQVQARWMNDERTTDAGRRQTA